MFAVLVNTNGSLIDLVRENARDVIENKYTSIAIWWPNRERTHKTPTLVALGIKYSLLINIGTSILVPIIEKLYFLTVCVI